MIEEPNLSATPRSSQINSAATALINVKAELRHDRYTAAELKMSLEAFRKLPSRAVYGSDKTAYHSQAYREPAVRPAPAATRPGTLQLMKAARRWLVWKLVPNEIPGKKPKKVPYYTNRRPRTGTLDAPEDWAQLADYETANAIASDSRNEFMLGFALGPDGNYDAEGNATGWQGFDRDGALIAADEFTGGYVETSPSGTGGHCIGYGRLFKTKVEKPKGEEWYSHGRFFTVTKDVLFNGPVIDLYPFAGSGPPAEADGLKDYVREPENLTQQEVRDIKSALRAMDPDTYENWYRVLLVLRGVVGGREIALEWSETSDKHSAREFEKKFDTVGEPVGHWKSIFIWAKAEGWNPAAQSKSLKGPMVPVDYEIGNLRPVEFLLNGFVPTGSMTISGSGGVGKTSIIVPWACIIAHLTQDNLLTPPFRRVVYFVSEDIPQVERILFGMKKIGFIESHKTSDEEIKRWLKLIPSAKRSVEELCTELKKLLSEAEPVMYKGHVIEPLVIFDTAVSNMEIENQNDNAEIGSYISNTREAVSAASVWFITHVSKAAKNGDPESMSARGGDSWVADVQGEMIIFRDPNEVDVRRAMLGKTRISPKFTELVCRSEVHEAKVNTWWGEEQAVLCRAAVVFVESDKSERAAAKAEAAAEKRQFDLEHQVREMVKAFKDDLAACGSIFVSSSPGKPSPPAGVEMRSIDIYLTIGKNTANRDMLRGKLREVLQHEEVPGGIVFRKKDEG